MSLGFHRTRDTDVAVRRTNLSPKPVFSIISTISSFVSVRLAVVVSSQTCVTALAEKHIAKRLIVMQKAVFAAQ